MGGRYSSSNPAIHPPNTQLADFSLVRPIGRGSFGKVCIVYHRTMKDYFACKYMSKKRLIQNSVAQNVIRELELLRQLSHPFIVKLCFAYQDDQYIFEINELMLGGDLRFHLNEQGRFSEERAKLYLCEVALALDYLHKTCQIVHRDIKPENILLDSIGHAHITDFNLAVQLEPNSLANSFSGTRLYMAPEVLKTSLAQIPGYDFRVDWWSLGVCFYEMIRGIRPFEFPPQFSSSQVLKLMSGSYGPVLPANWSSDLVSLLSGILNFDLDKRICSFDRFSGHHYLANRMNMEQIMQRRTAPVFIPRRGKLNCDLARITSERRATNSMSPLHMRLQRRHSKLRHMQAPKQGSAEGHTSKGSSQQGEECTCEALEQLATTFTEYNRFTTQQTPTKSSQWNAPPSTQYSFASGRDVTCSL